MLKSRRFRRAPLEKLRVDDEWTEERERETEREAWKQELKWHCKSVYDNTKDDAETQAQRIRYFREQGDMMTNARAKKKTMYFSGIGVQSKK